MAMDPEELKLLRVFAVSGVVSTGMWVALYRIVRHG